MAAKTAKRKNDVSIYFRDTDMIARARRVGKRLGWSRNQVLVKILERELPRYERKPELLIR